MRTSKIVGMLSLLIGQINNYVCAMKQHPNSFSESIFREIRPFPPVIGIPLARSLN